MRAIAAAFWAIGLVALAVRDEMGAWWHGLRCPVCRARRRERNT